MISIIKNFLSSFLRGFTRLSSLIGAGVGIRCSFRQVFAAAGIFSLYYYFCFTIGSISELIFIDSLTLFCCILFAVGYDRYSFIPFDALFMGLLVGTLFAVGEGIEFIFILLFTIILFYPIKAVTYLALRSIRTAVFGGFGQPKEPHTCIQQRVYSRFVMATIVAFICFLFFPFTAVFNGFVLSVYFSIFISERQISLYICSTNTIKFGCLLSVVLFATLSIVFSTLLCALCVWYIIRRIAAYLYVPILSFVAGVQFGIAVGIIYFFSEGVEFIFALVFTAVLLRTVQRTLRALLLFIQSTIDRDSQSKRFFYSFCFCGDRFWFFMLIFIFGSLFFSFITVFNGFVLAIYFSAVTLGNTIVEQALDHIVVKRAVTGIGVCCAAVFSGIRAVVAAAILLLTVFVLFAVILGIVLFFL